MLIELGFYMGVVAFVYAEILTDSEMILEKWKQFLYLRIGKYDWLFKPLVGCAYCVAGQLGLWIYLYICFTGGAVYSFLDQIVTICLSIFTVAIIKRFRIYEE